MKCKKVRYNGGTQSYYGCSSPNRLKKGKVYEVLRSRDRGSQTDLTLKGVYGEFNDVWFDDVSGEDTIGLYVSNSLPDKNETFHCEMMRIINDRCVTFSRKIKVKKIKKLCGEVYDVTDFEDKVHRVYVADSKYYNPKGFVTVGGGIPKVGHKYTLMRPYYDENGKLHYEYQISGRVLYTRFLGVNQYLIRTLTETVIVMIG